MHLLKDLLRDRHICSVTDVTDEALTGMCYDGNDGVQLTAKHPTYSAHTLLYATNTR